MNFLIYLFVVVILSSNSNCDEIQELEASLIKNLFVTKGYNKNVRPNPQVTVYITMYVRQLTSLDEKNQIMTTTNYFSIRYYDDRLEWNEDGTWGNLTRINVPVSNLWFPDLFVVNSADTNGFISVTANNLAYVENDGYVYALVTAINLKTRCQMSVRNFPFDTQKCPIIISSWALTFDKFEFADISLAAQNRINNNSYIPNQVWKLVRINESRSENYERYPLEEEPIEELIFEFVIKRFPMYYMITGIFPCFVLNVVTLLSYALPFGTQVGLCMTTFLTFSVYSLRVAGDIPVQSEYLPIIIIYFLFSVSYTLLSLMWFVLSDFFLARTKMPKWLEAFARLLKKILFFLFPTEKKVEKFDEIKSITKEANKLEEGKQDTKEEGEDRFTNLRQRILASLNSAPDASVPISSVAIEEKTNCFKCGFCQACKDSEKKDKDKKKEKELFASHVLALNYFAWFIMFIFILATNLTLWIVIGSGNE